MDNHIYGLLQRLRLFVLDLADQGVAVICVCTKTELCTHPSILPSLYWL